MSGNVTLSTGIALNKAQSAYPHLWDGLVGLWSPDLGKQSDRLYDFSQRFHHADLTNMDAETDYVSGKFGYALNFDGTDDYLHMGNIPEINDASQDLTFAYWMRTETPQGNNAMFMYDTNDALSPGTDIYCMFKGNLTIGGIGDGSEWNTGYASSNFQDGKWHHIVIVLEGGNEYVYKDAQLVASRAVAHNHGNYGASHNFRIADNSNVGHYVGDIGTFLLYNRALQPHEVVELYSGASPLQLSFPISLSGFSGATPFLTDYTKRKKITIDSTKIDAPLTDLVVLVKLEDGINFAFNAAKADGADIRFTTDDGLTLLDFEREFHGEPPPVISGDITGSGTASASSFFSGAFDPENPVDDLLTTSWLSNGQSPASAEWWQYDFGAGNEKVIVRYTLEYNLNLNQSLTAWQFEGSNDAVQWTVLDTQSGFSFQGQTKETFDIVNGTAYRYYRINVIDSVDGNFCDFSEIEMMESLSGKIAYYWVRIPSVLANENTNFYIYYGNPTAEDALYSDDLTNPAETSIRAFADSEFNGSHLDDSAFDDNRDGATNRWAANGGPWPHWIGWDFGVGNEQIINAYEILPRNDGNWFEVPKDWKVQGSNDSTNGTDGTWDDLDVRTGEVFSQNVARTFQFATENTTAYRWYRIRGTANQTGGNTNMALTEVQFFSGIIDPKNVWSSDQKAVYHLKSDIKDSTLNANDLTNTGAGEVDGQIYKAYQFGSGKYMEASDDSTLDITTGIRLRAWIKSSDYNQNLARIIEKAGTGDSIYLLGVHQNSIYFGLWSSGSQTFFLDAGTLTNGQEHFIVAEWDGVDMKAYIDGVEVKTTPFSGPIDTSNETLNIGRRKNPTPIYWGANDYIDEVRVGDTAKGAAHAKAEFYTENGTLLSFAQEEVSTEFIDETDDITLSDQLVFSLTKSLDLQDTLTLADQAIVDDNKVNEPENITLSDQIQTARTIILDLLDSIILADSDNIFTSVAANEAENITLSDVIDLIRTVQRVVDKQESVTLTDDINLQLPSSSQEEITLNDSVNIFGFLSTDQQEAITLSDQIQTDSAVNLNLSEQILLSDQGVFSPSDIDIAESDTIELSDQINIFATTGTAKNASKILSFNPLVIVSDSSPMKVVRVDITNPAGPTWEIFTFSSLSNAKDASYNAVFDLFYVACADGKILELDGSDFGISQILDTGDLNNLQNIVSLDAFHRLYAGTDDPLGEVLYIDQALIANLNLDIQCLQQVNGIADTDIRVIQGGIFGTDIQCLGTQTNRIGLDIRVISDPFNEIAVNPVKQTDFHVQINGSEIDDVLLDAIRIYHSIGEKSTATFTVRRRHDELDKTVAGQSSQITNQNDVQIYILGNLEFSGKVARIRTNSESETVEVSAQGDEKTIDKKTITLPLASVNEKLHPYHCLVDNEDIYNPVIDSEEEDPELYFGIEVDLGTDITQNISRWIFLSDVADEVLDGTFQPKQNWTYFWFCRATNYLTGIKQASSRYVGTSPAALTGDLWEMESLTYRYQREFDDKEKELGTYQIGSAPFKQISTRNGCKNTKSRWIDQDDGLYREKDAGYNYVEYTKTVAQLEYEKIQNINGSVLPITSCDIELMIDGYFYYNPRLLTRINIDNTTTSGIYKNNNGFPVAVKAIEIDSRTMQVQMKCDNQKSDTELQEIDEQYPDPESDEFLFEEESVKQFSKFDYSRFESVQ